MNPVVHFEMPYDDPARLAKFYQSAFGWKTKDLGEKMGHYVTAMTSASGPDGTPRKQGMINGGFFARKPDWPAQNPSVVIAVDDIRKAMDKVRSSGGDVLGGPMDIPGIGAYVSFTDTEGNRVGMLEPLPMMEESKKKPAAKKAATKKRPAAKRKSKRRG
jgi:predicted enzyme related to lactoylglutathione lyase